MPDSVATETATNDETTAEVLEVPVSDASAPSGEAEEAEDGAWDSERALAKIRKANAEAKRLRERVKEAEAKADTAVSLETQLAEAKEERDKAVAEAMRTKVAHAYGLPPEIASRLQGDSQEELQADAEKLLGIMEAGRRPVKRAPLNPPATNVADRDIADMVAGLL
nr:MAG TPA: protein of unknown function (DUF4355) [Caudoviricetes sp.]